MPSILPPASDMQLNDALSDLSELAPPCEYTGHGTPGCGTGGPAVWIVWLDADCCQPVRLRLFCSDCWRARNSAWYLVCKVCAARLGPPMDLVLRVERL